MRDDDLREALLERGFEQAVRNLENRAVLLPRIAMEMIDHEVAAMHNTAGRLPVIALKDYGAILFEAASDAATVDEKKLRFYREASYRISWACAGEEFGTRFSEDDRRVGRIEDSSADRLNGFESLGRPLLYCLGTFARSPFFLKSCPVFPTAPLIG